MVVGGGLSFVGKHQEKLMAGQKATLKMVDALEKWPDSFSVRQRQVSCVTHTVGKSQVEITYLDIFLV